MNIRTDYTEFIGRKFGVSTVVRQVGVLRKNWTKPRIFPQWELQCQCGKLFIVSHDNLVASRIPNRNCGCLYRKDLTGQKFGQLTVIKYLETKYVGKSKGQHAVWECLCDCGKITNVTTGNLCSFQVQSCGCGKGFQKFLYVSPNHTNNYKYMFKKLKMGAKSRNLEFSITLDDLKNLLIKQNFKCALSGLPIKVEDCTASIDRIDSSKGYTIDNIQAIYKTYNMMKSILTQQEFIQLCKLVSNNNPSY